MLRLTLAQMRRSVGRLVSAGIAIAIGTAFVAATLLVGNVITRTTYDAVAASYARADLVVAGSVTPQVVSAVRATPGVAAVSVRPQSGLQLSAGAHRAYVLLTEATSEPRLEAQTLAAGAFPSSAGEIALPRKVAERLGLRLGDQVDASHYVSTSSTPSVAPAAAPTDNPTAAESPGAGAGTTTATPAEPAAVDWVEKHDRLTVVGLVDDPANAFSSSGGAAVLTASQVEQLARDQAGDQPVVYSDLILAVDHPADLTTVQQHLVSVLPDDVSVHTKDEQAQATVAGATGDTKSILVVVLGFAAVALLVAALVISNTFQVIIAQRTRTLALLRCVGADKGQLRRSVLVEATILGLASSTVGLLTGVTVVQLTLQILQRTYTEVHLPSSAPLSVAALVVPVVIGTVVTLVAGLAPARAATRVAPLAALRPAEAPSLTGRPGRARLVAAGILTLGGAAALVGAVALAAHIDSLAALGLGVLGGAVSFVGVLVSAVLWMPRVVGAAGRLVSRSGATARLAVANTVRNPRRTAATSTALLIGVTLVTMMSAGAVSARATLVSKLDATYPVDVSVRTIPGSDGSATGLPPGVASTVGHVDGVRTVVPLTEAAVLITPEVGTAATTTTTTTTTTTVHGISAADAATVVRDRTSISPLDDRTLVLSTSLAKAFDIRTGDVVDVAATDQTGRTRTDAAPVRLTVAVTALRGQEALVTPTVMAAVDPGAPTPLLWAQLATIDDAPDVVPAIQDALTNQEVDVTGGAVERATFQQVIDTLLAVVVGLLGVAVVIALVGVANTLSLSVIERRRESATLRAIGLARRQLRVMLAIEGMLIAGVGAVLGIGLGLVYGWAGAATMLGSISDVQLAVPWRDIGLVLLVALIAGFVASVVPGRAAARTSPVAALAVN
jgi:putative ABC transport system permease protein